MKKVIPVASSSCLLISFCVCKRWVEWISLPLLQRLVALWSGKVEISAKNSGLKRLISGGMLTCHDSWFSTSEVYASKRKKNVEKKSRGHQPKKSREKIEKTLSHFLVGIVWRWLFLIEAGVFSCGHRNQNDQFFRNPQMLGTFTQIHPKLRLPNEPGAQDDKKVAKVFRWQLASAEPGNKKIKNYGYHQRTNMSHPGKKENHRLKSALGGICYLQGG